MTPKKLAALFVPAVLVIAIDQLTKWIIRTTPELHRYDVIDGWLAFYYTQNDGMAMGIDIFSTPVVSSISILATIGILSYLLYTMDKSPVKYLIFMGLVIGGALGNITDRLTMGFIEGYGGLLDGHVVDFIHFNLEINDWPVFPYIFNMADVAISVSIITLLVFNKQLMPHHEEEVLEEPVSEEESTVEETQAPVVEEKPLEEK
ncbi:MAG: signal peptidase II [Balneola sp.]|nr:MAG: signal peptidase II [Balneola sp.]